MKFAASALLGLSTLLSVTADVVDNESTKALNLESLLSLVPLCPIIDLLAPPPDYDYIVVGSGAGGGPIAARLALAGFSVLVIDAGKDYVNVNTTIPLYLARAPEDKEVALEYWIDHFPPGHKQSSIGKVYYPRGQGLGGSVIHNALIHQIPHNWDFDHVRDRFNDDSWSATNMHKYLAKIENNLYIPPDIGTPLGHGYGGWLDTTAPLSNLLTDPKYYDPKLIDMFTGTQNAVPVVPGSDWSTPYNDLAEGGGIIPLTRNSNHTRCSIRDHLVATQKKTPKALTFKLETVVSKIHACRNLLTGQLQARGVAATTGAILPVSPKFTGKKTLALTNYYAKYEVIIATGAYQTPQLLMLSGIGPSEQLKKFGIPQLVNLPGVGENLQDRLEMTIISRMKEPWVIWKDCKFGYSPESDPCLAEWEATGHTNLYASGPASYAHAYKSDASLPYRDVWAFFGPGQFTGYKPGWGQELAQTDNAWVSVVLKAHTDARGWVRLTGDHIQDKAEINKNQGVTAGWDKDVEIVKTEMRRLRKVVADTPYMAQHVESEYWPGSGVSTDAQLTDFIEKNTWGHHACCTSKMGVKSDKLSVIDNNFKVYGIDNLRIVDISAWAEIPGFFPTTPTYMMSEKAADTVKAYAASKGWKPTYDPVA